MNDSDCTFYFNFGSLLWIVELEEEERFRSTGSITSSHSKNYKKMAFPKVTIYYFLNLL
jgi:hypothetical protein